MASDPDKRKVCRRTALDAAIRETWGELVKEFCERAFHEFAPPCKCMGNEAVRLTKEGDVLLSHELPGDQNQLDDPFDPAGVGEIGGIAE